MHSPRDAGRFCQRALCYRSAASSGTKLSGDPGFLPHCFYSKNAPDVYKLALLLIAAPCFCENAFRSRGLAARSVAPPEAAEFNGTLYASCKMKPSTKLGEGLPKVYGQVLFKQAYPTGALQMMISLKGFPRVGSQQRAIHIHQYGDLSKGCDSTGGHYNPFGVNHPGHPGDFGNFMPRDGRIRAQKSEGATLSGALSVLGRAVVVHEKEDDLGQGGDAGSLLHGNAGSRLACCIIGISSDELWNKAIRQHRRS